MDHAIEYLREYMAMDEAAFLDEWHSGHYESIKECPSYETVKAYCDAINTLTKAYYEADYARKCYISPIKIIRLYEEYEQ